jgi:hypothetical protein
VGNRGGSNPPPRIFSSLCLGILPCLANSRPFFYFLKKPIFKTMRCFALFLIIMFLPVFGYVDPGTGSYFLQLLIGSILGALFLLGQFRVRIVAFLKKLFHKKQS